MFNAQLQNSRLSAISIDVEANFSEADFEQAILKDINIKNLNAVGASMVGAELINATIDNSDFSSSKFYQAKLNNTIIKNSSLIESVFIDTEFIDVSFEGSKLDRAIYNPKIYENINLSKASGLSSLNFSDASPVRYLEKRAKEIGLIREDRALSAALRKYYISDLPIYEKVFEYFLFDFFTDSGENPFKPFFILIVSILPFSLIYIKALSCKTEDGIFKVWLKERIRKDLGINNPEKVKFKKITDIKTAFYFSFLSAFSIGWKELNVRYWIELIQCREYSLRATGWVRTVSGIQSLFSVYLLAMWALTYFGRPFEFYFGS